MSDDIVDACRVSPEVSPRVRILNEGTLTIQTRLSDSSGLFQLSPDGGSLKPELNSDSGVLKLK